MQKLTIVNREGAETEIAVDLGTTLMEAIRDNGFDELQALCGGCCSCGTCHVYIDGCGGGIPPATEDERDLLSGSAHQTSQSRLACQIALTAAFAGRRVTIAPES